MAESLVFSENPSARADLPGNIIIERCYGTLQEQAEAVVLETANIPCPGVTELPRWGLRITCRQAEGGLQTTGNVVLRSRLPGDEMRLPGGTKSLKKLFIDKKIPASQRSRVPVLADERGVLAVYGLGVNLDRVSLEETGVQFLFEEI
jgi:tRNA(Ile)-lysidine synthase